MAEPLLLTAIHDVCHFHAQRVERLVALVEQTTGGGKYALLVLPDFHGRGRIHADPAFCALLRRWADPGCDILPHGYRHIDDRNDHGFKARFASRLLTAGGGEFLGLDYDQAVARLRVGRAMIENIIGRLVAGFIAPAWLYGPQSLKAIADEGFALAEYHFRLWSPQTGETITRGPVLTYASRSKARLLSSILWSRVTTIALSREKIVRFGVHPGDATSPALIAEIKRAPDVFTPRRTPVTCSEIKTVHAHQPLPRMREVVR